MCRYLVAYVMLLWNSHWLCERKEKKKRSLTQSSWNCLLLIFCSESMKMLIYSQSLVYKCQIFVQILVMHDPIKASDIKNSNYIQWFIIKWALLSKVDQNFACLALFDLFIYCFVCIEKYTMHYINDIRHEPYLTVPTYI